MQKYRLALAFLIPPIIPVVAYTSLTWTIFRFSRGAPEIDMGVFFLQFLAVAYALLLIVWVPVYLVLRHFKRTQLHHFVLAGAVSFGLAPLIFSKFQVPTVLFPLLCALVGAVYALVFVKIAGSAYTTQL